tara:strand:+ start:310 stop:573 length:264 start_codon:yes stop_codon:yes gene_type:complete
MIKLSLNMDITISVSPDYLQRVGLDFDSDMGLYCTIDESPRIIDRETDIHMDSNGTPTPLAQSAINQCFRNNSRVLDSLTITDIQKE